MKRSASVSIVGAVVMFLWGCNNTMPPASQSPTLAPQSPTLVDGVRVWPKGASVGQCDTLLLNTAPAQPPTPAGQQQAQPRAWSDDELVAHGVKEAKRLGGNATAFSCETVEAQHALQGNPHERQICKVNVLRCNDAQSTAASPPPNIVYASLKWEYGELVAPLGQALSSDQERGVHTALGALPDFPSNALNGCESRAHATYLAIHQASGQKSYKIWLLSAPLVAPGFNGSIRYKDGGAWNYHVAAAYATEGQGVVVVDTLMSKTPQRLKEWLGRFTVEGWAVVVSTPPWQYIYGLTTVSGLEGIADFPSSILHAGHNMKRNVFNGTFLQYGGRISDVHDGAKAIASDALAAAIGQGKFGTCPWRQYSSNSVALIRNAAAFLPNVPSRENYAKHDEDCAKLQKNNPSAACPPFSVPQRTAPPAECAEAFQVFKSEYDRWAALGL